VNELKSV